MARKFLTNVDLNKNELLNAVIQQLASAPSSPLQGQIYYNTTDDNLYIWDGAAWVDLTVQGGGGSGDVVGPASSVDSEVVLFNSTTGKLIKRASISGIAKLTSGVLSAATEGTDYYGGGGTDVLVTDGGTGRSTSTTAYGLIAAGTTATGVQQTIAPGTSGHFLKSAGGAALASFAAIAESDVVNLVSDLALKAPLASPTFTGNVTVPTPSASTDAANKAYVDAAAVGIDWKPSVRAATTANGALATAYENGDIIDGVTLATGDRILIKNQSTGSENGIYTVNASGAPTRATDADANAEVTSGLAVFVEEGTTNADSGWMLTTNGAITVNTTALTFTQFTGLGQIVAGAALTQTGNTLDVATDNSSIEVNADALRVKAAGVTNAMLAGSIAASKLVGTDIVTVGTLSAGNATAIVDAATTTAAGKSELATAAEAEARTDTVRAVTPVSLANFPVKKIFTIGDNAATQIDVTHSLGTKDVITQVRQASDDAVVECDITNFSTSVVRLNFAVAPATNAIKVVVMG